LRPTKRRPLLKRPPRPPSRALLTQIKSILEAEGFQIQMKKRVRIQRPHQRQTATGLVVNRTVNLPRRTRRLIRAMQHRERMERLDAEGRKRLRGLEALTQMVDSQR